MANMNTNMLRMAMLLAGIVLGHGLAAQVPTEVPPVVSNAKPGAVEHIRVHGSALEGNLEGDAVDREVFVFLPPSYAKDKSRRYPVVYALHGYSIGAEQWTHEIHVPQTNEGAFAQGAQGMIVVLPRRAKRSATLCITQQNAALVEEAAAAAQALNEQATGLMKLIGHYRVEAPR
jgi:hypothetical protein